MKPIRERYILTEEDRVLLRNLSEHTPTKGYEKFLMDSFDALF